MVRYTQHYKESISHNLGSTLCRATIYKCASCLFYQGWQAKERKGGSLCSIRQASCPGTELCLPRRISAFLNSH